MGLRDLIRGARQARRPVPGVAAYLDDLARSPQMAAVERARQQAKLDAHFERPVDMFAGVEADIPMSRQLADADVGTFGNPAVQRMMRDAEMFDTARALQSGDVVDMLARNDRINTLAGVNARRYGGERGDLWMIAQDNIARGRMANRRAAWDTDDTDMIADAALGAGLGLGGMYAAGLVQREMDDDRRDAGPLTGANIPESALPIPDQYMNEDASVYLEPSEAPDVIDSLDGVNGDVFVPPEDMQSMAAMLYPQVYDKSMEGLGGVNRLLGRVRAYSDLMGKDQGSLYREQDGFYMGRPNVEGLSDFQQARMDALIRSGVPEQQAMDAARGVRPLTEQEMQVQVPFSKGKQLW